MVGATVCFTLESALHAGGIIETTMGNQMESYLPAATSGFRVWLQNNFQQKVGFTLNSTRASK